MDEAQQKLEIPESVGGTSRRHEKKNRRPLLIGLLAGAAVVAAVCAAVLLTRTPDLVYPEIRVEAGEAVPDATAFLKAEGAAAEYGSDISLIDTTVPGTYPVTVNADGHSYECAVTVSDTIPPEGETQDASIWLGDTCEPKDFVRHAYDATGVRYTFAGDGPVYSKVGFQDGQVDLCFFCQ